MLPGEECQVLIVLTASATTACSSSAREQNTASSRRTPFSVCRRHARSRRWHLLDYVLDRMRDHRDVLVAKAIAGQTGGPTIASSSRRCVFTYSLAGDHQIFKLDSDSVEQPLPARCASKSGQRNNHCDDKCYSFALPNAVRRNNHSDDNRYSFALPNAVRRNINRNDNRNIYALNNAVRRLKYA
nr:unnamed protein product [Spirometra erinaceieuropaei]